MKSLIFDASAVISITMNNLLWMLSELKKHFEGEFCICREVKSEIVDNPLNTKRFEFDALQVLQSINSGILSVREMEDAKRLSFQLLDLANHSFRAKGSWINIVHKGEIESLATCILMKSDAFVVDERTTRLLIESPRALKDLLQSKLHSRIDLNRQNLHKFAELSRGVKVIRSVELATIAFEKGILDQYLLPNGKEDPKRVLLDAVLWSLKLKGCAIPKSEINEIVEMEIPLK
ncbi:MAG: hypothetical protein NTV63_03370 [Candidatus Woesearchaeota archaeon]|nr:hypothetical protein [Candidatus Woesearchaeota archaeon]